jgi:hypothetical protein
MIKELSRAFKALVDLLSAKPLATITALFIVLAGYVSVKSYTTLQSLVVTPDQEAARFEAQLTNSDIINRAIEKLRSDLGADNVLIRQFHNGRHDLTGIPFTGISTTFYVDPLDNNGHEPSSDEPISAMNRSLRQVWQRIDKPDCSVFYSPVDISTRKYFKAHNLNRAVVCPLVNLLNYPIGVLIVGFSASSTISDQTAINQTSLIAKSVTGYLNDGH